MRRSIQAPTFTASEGTVNGDQFDSTSLVWDTANNAEQRKTVTITAKAAGQAERRDRHHLHRGGAAPVVGAHTPARFALPGQQLACHNCGKRILFEQLRAYTTGFPRVQSSWWSIGGATETGPRISRRNAP